MTMIMNIIVGVLLAIYAYILGSWAFALLMSGEFIGAVMAVAILLFSALGVWSLWREILFGVQSNRLIKILESEGELLDDPELTAGPDGRPNKHQAIAVLDKYSALAKKDPENWRPLLRYALVLRAAGEHKPARAAVREAIGLQKHVENA